MIQLILFSARIDLFNLKINRNQIIINADIFLTEKNASLSHFWIFNYILQGTQKKGKKRKRIIWVIYQNLLKISH